MDIEALLQAAALPDRGGLTRAGRALAKHGGRPGAAFPPPVGGPTAINQAAQVIVEDILRDPLHTSVRRHHLRFGDIIEVRASDRRGVRYDDNGNFIGLLEP